jgi:hypothetical protein
LKLEYQHAKLEEVVPSGPAAIISLVKEEVDLFDVVLSFDDFARFLRATSYKTEIMASPQLQHIVAPTLFRPTEVRTLLSNQEPSSSNPRSTRRS